MQNGLNSWSINSQATTWPILKHTRALNFIFTICEHVATFEVSSTVGQCRVDLGAGFGIGSATATLRSGPRVACLSFITGRPKLMTPTQFFPCFN